MNKSYSLLSIIIPVHNQAHHIESVIEKYISALRHLPCKQEYILVVNGCQDASLDVCNKLKLQQENLNVIHIEQGGWGNAVKVGLKEATGDLICFTNSARTSPQDLILLACYAIANPNVVIKANRKIRSNLKRRIGSLLYNLECRTLFDLNYWDINGTPKIFPKQFSKLLELKSVDDLIDLEFNVICKTENYPLIEVPIFSTKRHSGKSTTNYISAMKMYLGAFKLCRKWNHD